MVLQGDSIRLGECVQRSLPKVLKLFHEASLDFINRYLIEELRCKLLPTHHINSVS